MGRVLAILLGLVVTAASSWSDARPVSGERPLRIGPSGCEFSRDLRDILARLPEHQDMQVHTETQAASFAFGGLHGLAVMQQQDAEWSEIRLYFREGPQALTKALARMGLRTNAHGEVAVPKSLEDDSLLHVGAYADVDHNVVGARSYLSCGSL